MTRRFSSCASAFLLVGVIALGCGSDPKKPGYEVFKDMKHSVAYDAFAPNPNVKDGKTLQALPQGTIPRDFAPHHYGSTPEELARAGKELENPYTPTPEILGRGKHLYMTFCAVCHGEQGNGDGPVASKYIPPPAFSTPFMSGLSAGWIYHVITRGNNMIMPSYATQIAPEDRWKLVTYIAHELQKKPQEGAKP